MRDMDDGLMLRASFRLDGLDEELLKSAMRYTQFGLIKEKFSWEEKCVVENISENDLCSDIKIILCSSIHIITHASDHL